jgi:hypothetical protein
MAHSYRLGACITQIFLSRRERYLLDMAETERIHRRSQTHQGLSEILKLDGGGLLAMPMAMTTGELKVEINYAREMMTHLMRCKAKANELLNGELNETVTNSLDKLIRELQNEMRRMERNATQAA